MIVPTNYLCTLRKLHLTTVEIWGTFFSKMIIVSWLGSGSATAYERCSEAASRLSPWKMKNGPKPKFAQIMLHMPTVSRVEALAPTQLTQGCSSGGDWCAGLWFICEMPGAQLPHLLSPVNPISSRSIEPEIGLCPRSINEEMKHLPHTHTDWLLGPLGPNIPAWSPRILLPLCWQAVKDISL